MADARWAPRLIGGFFILCGVAGIVGGIATVASDVAYFRRADMAQARVEQLRTEILARSRRHYADLHFMTRDGEEIRTAVLRPNSRMDHAVGDIVLVHYDPQDPTRTSLEPLLPRALGALIALPFGTIFAAFGWMLAARRPRVPKKTLIGSGIALGLLLGALLVAG